MDDDSNENGGLVAWVIGLSVMLALAVAVFAGSAAFQSGSTSSGAPLLARVLFDNGVATLPADAAKTLAPVIELATRSAGGRLFVSGYHDKTGDPERNAELAKERAIAVRDALAAAGVALDRVELSNPQVTEGGTDDRLARRVDVTGE